MSRLVFKNVSSYIELAITSNLGDFVPGLTVSYSIYRSSDNSLVATGTVVSVGNVYRVPVTLTEVGTFRVEYTTPEGYQNGIEVFEVTNTLADQETMTAIKNAVLGRWKLDEVNNQLILYAEDNVTEIARFNTFDTDGQPTVDAVGERVRV